MKHTLYILYALATAAILTAMAACTSTEADDGNRPLKIDVDTRGIYPDEMVDINVNINGTTGILTLFDDGNTHGLVNAHVPPGATTVAAYAWANVKIGGSETPVIYADPTAPVTWDAGTPRISLKLTPATARVRIDARTITAATLHNIRVPDGGWIDTSMPPIVTADGNVAEITLPLNDTYAQVLPTTIPQGAKILTVIDNGITYTITADTPHTFLAGYNYTLNVGIAHEGRPVITNITIEPTVDGGYISADPNLYIIATEDDLRNFALVNFNGSEIINAMQIADITLSDTDFPGIGSTANAFRGTYYGNGHKISNMHHTINTDPGAGMFRSTYGATITDVHLVNPVIVGNVSVGALVGAAGGDTHITRCSVTNASVSGTHNIGALVGIAEAGTIIAACRADGTVTANENAGGIVGNSSGTIAFSYSLATVSAVNNFHGAIAGVSTGTIASCYGGNNPIGIIANGAGDIFNSTVDGSDIESVVLKYPSVIAIRTAPSLTEQFFVANTWVFANNSLKLVWE